MATESVEKLSFLENNERVILITESTKLHYQQCANELNRTHSQSERLEKEELCKTINNLIRQIGHEERLELHLQNSDWIFSLVKVRVVSQSDEEAANENNDFPSSSPPPLRRSASPPPLHSLITHHSSSPAYALRPRHGRPNYREAGQSSQSQPARRRRERPRPTATSSHFSHRTAGATISPLGSPITSRRTPFEVSLDQGNENNDDHCVMSSTPPPLHSAVTGPSSPIPNDLCLNPIYREAGETSQSQSSMRRTREDLRSEVAKIDGEVNEMLLKLKEEKKNMFACRKDWCSLMSVVVTMQCLLSEIPLSVNPFCLPQFQFHVKEQVSKLLNIGDHFEWDNTVFDTVVDIFERQSDEIELESNETNLYVTWKENSSIEMSNAAKVVKEIVETTSEKAKLEQELNEMEGN